MIVYLYNFCSAALTIFELRFFQGTILFVVQQTALLHLVRNLGKVIIHILVMTWLQDMLLRVPV